MVHVDDVLGIEADVLREEYKLKGEYWLGNIDPADFDAIWQCYRSQADARGGWGAATTKRSRLSQLRLSALAVDSLLAFESATDVEDLIDRHSERIRDSNGGDDPSAVTLNGYLQAVKTLFEWADASPQHGDFGWYRNIQGRERSRSRKDPAQMLDEADIARLREHAKFQRDKVFVEFLADTGLRRTAALQLRVADVDLESETFQVNPDGAAQKGVEDYEVGRWPLKDSLFFLRRWLAQGHPEAPEPDPGAPLFPKVEGYDPDRREECAASPKAVGHQVRQAAARAGVDKPTNLHSFRHASVKRDRWKYEMDWDVIQDRRAWSDESLAEMMITYGRLDEEERIDRMKRQLGYTVDEAEADAAAADPQCPNCGMDVEPSWAICPSCYVEIDEWSPSGGTEREVRRFLARFDGDTAELLNAVLDRAEADPELRAVLHD